jgi:hypothetical protein
MIIFFSTALHQIPLVLKILCWRWSLNFYLNIKFFWFLVFCCNFNNFVLSLILNFKTFLSLEFAKIVSLISFIEEHIFESITKICSRIVHFWHEVHFLLIKCSWRRNFIIIITEKEGSLSLNLSHARKKLVDEKSYIGIFALALQDFVNLIVNPIGKSAFGILDRRGQLR